MIKHTFSETIDRPVGTVWDWLTDPENTLKIEASAIELTKTPDAPLKVGSSWEGNLDLEGEKLYTVCELTELNVHKKMAFRVTNAAFDIVGEYQFEPQGSSATKVTSISQAEILGVYKEMEPMFAKEFERDSQAEFQAIKKAIEAGP